MSTSNRQVVFNIEDSLADVRLTPDQRRQALSAIRMAEGFVEAFGSLGGALKRLAELFAPKHSVRT